MAGKYERHCTAAAAAAAAHAPVRVCIITLQLADPPLPLENARENPSAYLMMILMQMMMTM